MLNGSDAIVVLTIITIIVVIYRFIKKNDNMTYVKSFVDNEYYLVRNRPDKQNAANLLATLKKNIATLVDTLYGNMKVSTDPEYEKNKPYIIRLKERTKNMIITESSENSIYTSYCINKGEEIVFCIRSKALTRALSSNIHDVNLLMYVALHEISHIACPEMNHTPLFKQIFKFICEEAIKQNLYTKIDFKYSPREYCGMTISESII